MNSCHTFEHQNIFIQDVNKVSNEKLLEKENKNSKFSIKKSKSNNEMAPIVIPKQTETVKKLALQKKVKIPNADKFSLESFINWNEEKLIKTLGKGHFIKEEGKLKNYQYHFKKCFIDVFLLKKNSVYIVNYIEKRPTKLNGTINIKACFEEVKRILN
jgi:hypothetical protein